MEGGISEVKALSLSKLAYDVVSYSTSVW